MLIKCGLRSQFPSISLLLLSLFASQSLFATSYYIDPLGSDSADGKSPATAWRTLDKVQRHSFSVGDDIYLKAGSKFENAQLVIGWNGRANNWVEVGCYRSLNNGRVAFDCERSSYPEINGTFEPSCVANRSCSISTSSAVPRLKSMGLVQVNSSYVRVRNLYVRDSAGHSVNTRSNENLHHITFEDLVLEHSAQSVLVFGRLSKHLVVRGVEGKLYNLCTFHRMSGCMTSGWPGGVVVGDARPAFALIENNIIHQGYGEGLNCLRASHVVMRGNRVGNVHSNGAYLDQCSNSIIENNIFWGDPNNAWHSNQAFTAVSVGAEWYGEPTRNNLVGHANENIIRNNLITGFGVCITAATRDNAAGKGIRIGLQAYGNTCIGAHKSNFEITQTLARESYDSLDQIVVKNNIFYSPGSRFTCRARVEKVEFDHNLWGEMPGDANCRSANDIIGDPMIATSLRLLQNKNFLDQPTPADFALRSGSPVLRAGTDSIPKSLDNLSEYSFVAQLSAAKPGCRSVVDGLPQDYHCRPREFPPSIGAIDRVNYPPQPPRLWATTED